eukprot:5672817-Alexandrium_andersonii.AAC.1
MPKRRDWTAEAGAGEDSHPYKALDKPLACITVFVCVASSGRLANLAMSADTCSIRLESVPDCNLAAK